MSSTSKAEFKLKSHREMKIRLSSYSNSDLNSRNPEFDRYHIYPCKVSFIALETICLKH